MNDSDRESLLESEQSLRKLKKAFGGWEPTLLAHADFMSRRYKNVGTEMKCANCGANAVDPVYIEWGAIYHTTDTALRMLVVAALGFVGGAYKKLHFVTAHRLCRSCLLRISVRRILSDLLDKLCFIGALLGAGGATMSLILVVVMATKLHRSEILELLTFCGIFLGCAGLLGLSLVGSTFSKGFPIPHSLRRIGKPPFLIHKTHKPKQATPSS